MNAAAPPEPRRRSLLGSAGLAGGMVVFAWFAHQPWPAGAAGVAGITGAAMAIVRGSPRGLTLPAVLGLGRAAASFLILGAVVGAAAGLAHRASIQVPMARDFTLEPFAVVACLIGATEEVIYRGWLIGRLRSLGWPAAIVLSAVAHAAYKTALFGQPAVAVPIDYVSLAWLTAAGGVLLGVLRAVSGSLWPALLAHAVFDLVVYGAVASAPWWVWG